MSSIVPARKEYGFSPTDDEPRPSVVPGPGDKLAVSIKGILDTLRAATAPNILKAPVRSARDKLYEELLEMLPGTQALPLSKPYLCPILRRLCQRVAYKGVTATFESKEAKQALIRQVLAEAKLALDLGYTQRELRLCLHKIPLKDLSLLIDLHPKFIVERALTRPDPMAAARELEAKRASHEEWVTRETAGKELGTLGALIANKSFRRKDTKDDPFQACRDFLGRFQLDWDYFKGKLPETAQRTARHLATRTFYGALAKRGKVLKQFYELDTFLTEDGRADKYKIRADIQQRTVGVAADPCAEAKRLLSSFEREYWALENFLPGIPTAVYRALGIRASMTVSSDRAERVAQAAGRTPVPVEASGLAARFEKFLSKPPLATLRHIGWLIAVDMTLSYTPEERASSHYATFRASLGLERSRCSDAALLESIDQALEARPEQQRGYLRRGLLGKFTSLAPGQLEEFSRMRGELQGALLKRN